MKMDYAQFAEEAAAVARQLAEHGVATAAGEGKALQQRPMEEVAAQLKLQSWIQQGGMDREALQHFVSDYLENSTHLHHPGYMAHQVPTPHLRGPVAALIHAFDNNGMNIYEMGPASATIEYTIVNWMLHHIGWQPMPWPCQITDPTAHGGGCLTHGGSLANLTALLAARARAFPNVWADGYDGLRPVILAPDSCHYSIARTAGMMGLGMKALIGLPTDANGVLRPECIAQYHQQALDDGQQPFALVANTCATGTGCYDPVDEVAEVCETLGLWLHLDGAHGASALISPETRHLLRGAERADSMIWDAHKMLAVPNLCAAVLFKRADDFFKAMRQQADYLFHDKEQPGFDFIEHTVECTKAAMGLRLFFNLAAEGERGMARHVAELYRRTHDFWATIQARPGYRCAVEPQANILCFRYGDADVLALRKELLRDGRFLVSTTRVDGVWYLRLVIINHHTTTETLETLLTLVEELAAEA